MGKVNMNLIRAKQAEQSKSGSSNDYDKLQPGKNIRRVLWPKGDNELFFTEGFVHFGVGSEGKTMVTCPKTWGENERCPICEYVDKLRKSKDEDDKKLASQLGRRKRDYMNVIDRDGDSEEPKVLPCGPTVVKAILDVMCDPDYADVTDPKGGRDVTISKNGQGLQTTYTVIAKPNVTPASSVYSDEELEEKMADLNKFFSRKSYEELEDILYGRDSDSNDDEDTKPSTATKPSSDTTDYEDMELEELEELCNKRGIKLPSKITKSRLVASLEDWDDEQGSDDADEAPARVNTSADSEEEDVQDAIQRALSRRKA